jgi:hypothetical protein
MDPPLVLQPAKCLVLSITPTFENGPRNRQSRGQTNTEAGCEG